MPVRDCANGAMATCARTEVQGLAWRPAGEEVGLNGLVVPPATRFDNDEDDKAASVSGQEFRLSTLLLASPSDRGGPLLSRSALSMANMPSFC